MNYTTQRKIVRGQEVDVKVYQCRYAPVFYKEVNITQMKNRISVSVDCLGNEGELRNQHLAYGQRKYTKSRNIKVDICNARDSGMSIDEIATAFNKHPDYIRTVVIGHSRSTKDDCDQRPTMVNIGTAALKMLVSSTQLSMVDLAIKLDVNRDALYKCIRNGRINEDKLVMLEDLASKGTKHG